MLKGIAKQDKLTLLKPFAYQNTYAVAMPEKLAKEYQIETISDLKAHADTLKAGFTLEFKDRADGYKECNLNMDYSYLWRRWSQLFVIKQFNQEISK